MSGSALITQPITLTGNQLWLNFSISAAGSLQVELQDQAGKTPPGYSLDDCDKLFGDTLDRNVVWKSKPDLSKLVGQTVRLRFVLHDPDVFSFQVRD